MFTPSIVVLMMMNTVAASGAALVALCGLPALEAAERLVRPAARVSEDDGTKRRGSGRHENDFKRPS